MGENRDFRQETRLTKIASIFTRNWQNQSQNSWFSDVRETNIGKVL